MINKAWDMLILLHRCLSKSPEKFRTIIFLYTLYKSLVLILWYLLSIGHYLLMVICFGYIRLIWYIYRWWTPGGTTKEARTCCRHPLLPWSNWWWCKLNCFSRWLRACKIMGMGMHPLNLGKEGRVSEGTSACFQTFHWPTPSLWLAVCNWEATWDCIVWWQREGFVCFWTAARGCTWLVGLFPLWPYWS